MGAKIRQKRATTKSGFVLPANKITHLPLTYNQQKYCKVRMVIERTNIHK